MPNFFEFNDEPDELALVTAFVHADQQAGSAGPDPAFIDACLAGVRAVEYLPSDIDPGWQKSFVYQVDMNNHFLWDLHQRSAEVAAIGEWTVETIENHGWGPDGNASPMGQRHNDAMALAAASGGGVRLDPKTGELWLRKRR